MINTNYSTGISLSYQKKLVKVIIDEKGYQNKPKNYMGAITKRMADHKNAYEVDLNQLANYITNGHAFAISYAEGGMTDNNFVSSDLVGLDFDGELTVNQVLDKLKEYHIPANIVYYTYSHGEKGERFRVITALSETVTNKDEYKQIIKGYQSLFGSNTDNATVGAVQRFLGTNKGLVRDIDPYSTASKQTFLELYKKNCKTVEFIPVQASKTSININDFDLQNAINSYNLLDYIKQTYPIKEVKPASGGVYVNPCPLCGHNDHLHITGNKFHSFGNKNCLALGGVGIVQWLIYAENLTVAQAIAKFKYELLGIDEKQDKREYAQAMAQKEENNHSSNDDKQKKPYFKIESLEKELAERGIEIKFNQIANSKDFFKNNNKLSKTEANEIPTMLYSELCDKYKSININLVGLYLNTIGKKSKYNPVLDLFNSNQWDGQDHLTKVYDVLNIATDDTLSRTLLLKWFWQGHALLRNNEESPFGADGVLVLTGKQGIGKTSFFAHMAIHPKFFREGQKLSSFDKDTERRCITTWIAELGEIDTTFKFADMGMLKAFITKSFDEYRLPYGREDEQSARRANFAATVNGDKFLIDKTGNRRFWTVSIESINLNDLQEINALQVWLQVWEQYAKHNLQGFRLTKTEQELLSLRNKGCEKGIKGEAEVLDILSIAEQAGSGYTMEYITVSQFKQENDILKGYSVEQLGKVLDSLGITREAKRINGKVQRVRLLPKRTYPNFD